MNYRPTRMPGIPAANTGDPQLNRWLDLVRERLEIMAGSRGNEDDAVISRRDLKALGFDFSATNGQIHLSKGQPGLLLRRPDGTLTTMNPDDLGSQMTNKAASAYKSSIANVNNFDGKFPEAIKQLLATSVADEAAKRGADIRRVEQKLQTTTESLAYTVTEVTAAMAGTSAGLREVRYASATANRATAGKVTQVIARLDDVGGITVEEAITAVADRATGLEGQYSIKIKSATNGVIAGFGLAATTSIAGTTTSAFLISADKFGIVSPGETITDPANPPVNRLPFGVDTANDAIYLKGSVRINASGTTLNELAINAATPSLNYIGTFPSAPSTVGRKKNEVYKNSSDGNTYVLNANAGLWVLFVPKGDSGARGSFNIQGVASSLTRLTSNGGAALWQMYGSSSTADAYATTLVCAALGVANTTSNLRIGDTVTLTNNSTVSVTGYWGGSSWQNTGVVIDGNLLVGGKISSTAIDTTQYVYARGIGIDPLTRAAVLAENSTHNGWAMAAVAYSPSAAGAALFVSTTGGVAVSCQGSMDWGAYRYSAPNGSSTAFMRNDGTWASSKLIGQFGATNGANDVTMSAALTGGASGTLTWTMTGTTAELNITVTSDRDLKTDVLDLDLGLDFINKLRPVSYRWNHKLFDKSLKHFGFIAQEVEPVIGPGTHMVSEIKHGPLAGYKAFSNEGIVAALVKSVQQLDAKFKSLKGV